MPSDPPDELLDIEVAFALPHRQTVLPLKVPAGTTVEGALLMSGLAEQYPGVDLQAMAVGIWGKGALRSTPLRNHDRVEVYRPLSVDPKLARRARAQRRAKPRPAANSIKNTTTK